MPTNLFEIAKKHRQLFFAFIGIVCILLLPIPAPTATQEENPDDSRGLLLSKNKSLSVYLADIDAKTSAIALWTSDTIKTPPSTILEIQIEHRQTRYISLKNILTEERKITIPLPPHTPGSLRMLIKAPSLDEHKALILRTSQNNKDTVAYTLYESKPILVALLTTFYHHDATADDIEYVWREGAGIVGGGNPYEKAAHVAHKYNKYATYFPLSYIVSAIIQKSGFASFASWLTIVRPIILISQLITAVLVLLFLYKEKKLALGIFGFFLILFHRFTLYPAQISQVDFPAIMFLLLGIFLLPQKTKAGYVLIGVSLAIKQMAIIVLPIFLIQEFSQHKSKKQTLFALVLMLIIPCITLVPFFINSPAGVRNSLSFSANRSSGGDFTPPDIATLLSLTGPLSRLGMYGLMGIIYIAFWKKEIGIFGACLAIFTIFIGFNPVLFFHYLAWVIPFVPLAFSSKPIQASRT